MTMFVLLFKSQKVATPLLEWPKHLLVYGRDSRHQCFSPEACQIKFSCNLFVGASFSIENFNQVCLS